MKSQEEQWLLAEKYNGAKSEAFYADCKALALGTPLGYLIGQVPFLDCIIHLDEQPLIPRFETEFWVDQAITAIKHWQSNQPTLFEEAGRLSALQRPQQQYPMRGQAENQTVAQLPAANILDLCAGSGCIGVAVAKAIPNSQVDFSELSKRLLPTIKKNCEENQIDSDRYSVYHSNLFAGIPADTKYDFILSNPPYIDPAMDRATDSVKSHEPHLALYGGVGGLEVIAQLIEQAKKHLSLTGQLWIEHEPEQSNAIKKIAHESNFVATTHHDQYKVERYSTLVIE